MSRKRSIGNMYSSQNDDNTVRKDVRDMRKDLDEMNLRISVELSRLDSRFQIIENKIDAVNNDVSRMGTQSKNDSQGMRVILIAFTVSFLVLSLLYVAANFGG